MKKMKKLLSMLLAVVMVLAMAAPSFAEQTESAPATELTKPDRNPSTGATTGIILIDNPIGKVPDEDGQPTNEDNVYKAYKIFDVTYSGKENDAYSILENSPWFSVIAEEKPANSGKYEVKSDENFKGLQIAKAASQVIVKSSNGEESLTNVYAVTVTNEFSAANFAKELSSALKNSDNKEVLMATAVSFTPQGDKVIAKDLPLGYYFVTTGAGALCNLTTTDPNVVIHEKNEVIFDKDIKGDPSVQVGQTVEFVIKGRVPDTTGLDNYLYKITDTMSAGLDLVKDSFVIKVGGAEWKKISVAEGTGDVVTEPLDVWEIPEGGDKAVLQSYTANGDKILFTNDTTNKRTGFTLYIDVNALNTANKVGQDIEITYNATVNDDAVTVISDNTANLTYKNGYDITDTNKTPDDKVEVYSSRIKVEKYTNEQDANGNTTKKVLAGAQFVLFRNGVNTWPTGKTDSNGNPEMETPSKKYYYKAIKDDNGKLTKVEWVNEDEWNNLSETEKFSDAFAQTTKEDGLIYFRGLKVLPNGAKYSVLETKAPAGYNILSESKEVELLKELKWDNSKTTIENKLLAGTLTDADGNSVTINDNSDSTLIENYLTGATAVLNVAGSILPSTGGIGTTIFYAAGIILMAGAVFFVVRRKKA